MPTAIIYHPEGEPHVSAFVLDFHKWQQNNIKASPKF